MGERGSGEEPASKEVQLASKDSFEKGADINNILDAPFRLS